MKKVWVLLFGLSLVYAEPQIFKAIGAKVIEKRNLGSLNEYVIEKNSKKMIVYETKDGKYIIIGAVLDAKSGENLTKKRYAEINKVDFAKIPLKEAIHLKFGKGGKKLVMISDPDCPYCRRAHEYLKKKDVDLYVFLYPLPIHPDAEKKSKVILCSKNAAKAYKEAMEGKEIKGNVCKEGVEKLASHVLVGQIVGVSGTPTFVLEDGRKVEGLDIGTLEKYLGGGK